MSLRIGYSFWGFLGDNKVDVDGKELSTPDGNATYSWTLMLEAMCRGHQVYLMQRDQDFNGWKQFKSGNFSAFNEAERNHVYNRVIDTGGAAFPELDVLLIEWRFPIPGRNCVKVKENGLPDFDGDFPNPDLKRQHEILRHYVLMNERRAGQTKIIFWDLDHKLTEHDEKLWHPDAIFETSVRPRRLSMDRIRVEPPCHIDSLLQHIEKIDRNYKNVDLAYIGSRYERDEMIDRLHPIAEHCAVKFHGKWDDDAKKRWPAIAFGKRITTKDFLSCYSEALGVPLLAKKSYLECGFVTPRIWEALLFGAIPIGFKEHLGIDQYVDRVVDWHEMPDLIQDLQHLDTQQYRQALGESVHKIRFMDAKHFVDKIEAVVR